MKARVLGALLVGVLVIPAGLVGGLPLSALVFALSLQALREMRSMLGDGRFAISLPSAAAGCVLIVLGAHLGGIVHTLLALALAGLWSMRGALVCKPNRPNSGTATFFAIAYVPFLLSHLVLVRKMGPAFLALPVLCTWSCDVLAYLVGSAIGRHKIAPRISPKKTWEGGIGGLLGSCVAALALSKYTGLGAVHSLSIGVLLGVGGQIGDLAESMLKRSAGVKDTADLIPGHGGVLDRFDSLLFNGTLSFYALNLLLKL